MKKISTFLLLIVGFLFVGMFTPNTYATSNVTLNLNVITEGAEGAVVTSTEFVVPFANTTSLNLSGLGLTGTETAIMVHNDQIVPTNTNFVMSASLNLSIIVKDSEDDYVAVFVDTNGELVDVVYNPINEPSTLVSLSKPGYNTATFDTAVISEDTIFIAQYVKSNETSISVTVLGGTKNLPDPKYNDVVTITSTTPGFTHWEDEAGNIVSYQQIFSFSILDNITLTASTGGISKPNIYMRNVSGIRSGYDSLLAYIEPGSNHNILEYGYLVSHLEGPVLLSETQEIPSQSLSQRNEFLRSFIEDEYNQFIAYATLMNTLTDEIVTIYSNGYNAYELNITINSPAYTPERIYIAGNMNGWNTSSSYIDKVENIYSNNSKVLAKAGDILNYKLLSGTSWFNQAFYDDDRTNPNPTDRTHTFNQDLQVNLSVTVDSWKTLPISSLDPMVEPGNFRVYFFFPWANISHVMRIHYFNQSPSTTWPGVDMIYSQGGYYYYDVPSSTGSFGIVFNDSGNQSFDLIFNQNAPYYYYTDTSGKWVTSTWDLT